MSGVDDPRCADCRFVALEEHTIYCTHPSVFERTGYGQECGVMRRAGGLCEDAKLFQAREESFAERRMGDRRRAERRYVAPTPWWRANWKGVVGIIAGIVTILTPILEHQYRMKALEQQYQLDVLRAKNELLKERVKHQLDDQRK